MPATIDLARLRELIDQDAQLLEVLPREAYEDEHIPGAINIPLKELDRDAVAPLDPTRPVVTYCFDSL